VAAAAIGGGVGEESEDADVIVMDPRQHSPRVAWEASIVPGSGSIPGFCQLSSSTPTGWFWRGAAPYFARISFAPSTNRIRTVWAPFARISFVRASAARRHRLGLESETRPVG
jgi:hypothetical protein